MMEWKYILIKMIVEVKEIKKETDNSVAITFNTDAGFEFTPGHFYEKDCVCNAIDI